MNQNFAEGKRDVTRVGVIEMYAGAMAPPGALICNGATISDIENGGNHADKKFKELFELLKSNGFGNDGTEDWATDTVKLPNIQGIGVVGAGSQSINGNTKGGGNLGDTVEDQMQGHTHLASIHDISGTNGDTNGIIAGFHTSVSTGSASRSGRVLGPISDGTNGTPRTGSEARISSVAVNFIIWY